MSDQYEIIADNIKALRQKKGWAQTELAARIGVDSSFVCNIEKVARRSLFNVKNMTEIAQALDVCICDVINVNNDCKKSKV